jgi:predicted ATPase with chaperone activity
MPFHNSRLIASALFAGLVAMPAAALAQSDEPAAQSETQTQQAPQQQMPQAEAIEPTDEQLDAFATATIDIVQIQEAAQQQMQAAVEEAGLTIEEYNQIAQAAQTDPDIDQALQQLIQDRIGG